MDTAKLTPDQVRKYCYMRALLCVRLAKAHADHARLLAQLGPISADDEAHEIAQAKSWEYNSHQWEREGDLSAAQPTTIGSLRA